MPETNKKIEPLVPEKEYPGLIGGSEQFAALNRLILRDPNDPREFVRFGKFKKKDLARYLADPSKNE